MANTSEEFQKKFGQVVAKCWADEAFKRRLLTDPVTVLKDYGISAAPGVQLKVVENTASDVTLVIPPKPEQKLSDEQLDNVAGGVTIVTGGGTISLCVSW